MLTHAQRMTYKFSLMYNSSQKTEIRILPWMWATLNDLLILVKDKSCGSRSARQWKLCIEKAIASVELMKNCAAANKAGELWLSAHM